MPSDLWRTIEKPLFMPPSLKLANSALARVTEKLGRAAALRGVSGALIIEATKQVYAYAPGRKIRRSLPRFKPAFLPAPQHSHKGQGIGAKKIHGRFAFVRRFPYDVV